MCYSVSSLTKARLDYARHRADDPFSIAALEKELEELLKDEPPLGWVNGFAHPRLLVFTQSEPMKPRLFRWGLVPSWVRDREQASLLAKQTLNARSESLWEKPSFRDSAKSRRCLIIVDAFFEYHHQGKTKFLHRMRCADDKPLCLAGLYAVWGGTPNGIPYHSCSIVTTEANPAMTLVHNQSKSGESRMPVVLNPALCKLWLAPDAGPANLQPCLQPVPTETLCYEAVQAPVSSASGSDTPLVIQPPELWILRQEIASAAD
jgi:putative SOS response-associated peptidase YedK